MGETWNRRVTANSTRARLGQRYKMAKWANLQGTPFKRHIDGKLMFGVATRMDKTDAEFLAAKYRRMGYLARVLEEWSGWTVYVRKDE